MIMPMSTMKEIAQNYKKTATMLRIAIQDCDMEIDTTELCEHYYDSAIPTRMSPYTSIGMKAPRFDATKK